MAEMEGHRGRVTADWCANGERCQFAKSLPHMSRLVEDDCPRNGEQK